MINLGYIVYDSHPLLQTISPEDIPFCKDKPLLIVGVANASLLFPDLELDKKLIKDNIYYTFSPRESQIKYQEHINEFVDKCFQNFTSKLKVHFLISFQQLKISNQIIFIHKTDTKIIVSASTDIFVFNKAISQYFYSMEDLESSIIKHFSENNEIVSWFGPKYFQAYLKSNNISLSEKELIKKTRHIANSELYLGSICLDLFLRLSLKSNIELWQRAFRVENMLSISPIRIDVRVLKKHLENKNNSFLQTIYNQLNKNHVYQHCNGTDKITGRIYPSDSISLQTLPKQFRDIVICNNNSKLVEIDYQYFEYHLLNQLCDMSVEGDPHEFVATKLFKDKNKRDIAKKINYSLMYGKSIDKIIIELKEEGINTTSLEKELREFLQPTSILQESLKEEFLKKGEIKNYFGRNIYPEKEFALLNNYIQSTAADFMIIKIDKLFDLLKEYPKSHILFQNHDSIVFTLNNDDIADGLLEQIVKIMQSPENKLRALVDIKMGGNWRDVL